MLAFLLGIGECKGTNLSIPFLRSSKACDNDDNDGHSNEASCDNDDGNDDNDCGRDGVRVLRLEGSAWI